MTSRMTSASTDDGTGTGWQAYVAATILEGKGCESGMHIESELAHRGHALHRNVSQTTSYSTSLCGLESFIVVECLGRRRAKAVQYQKDAPHLPHPAQVQAAQ